MIQRDAESSLKKYASQYPVVTIFGPRQSGKTTLAQTTFASHAYISLEDLDKRALASSDPRTFLEINKNEYGLILDEIQHVPSLLSYIQTYVDAHDKPGYFILTGSQNFLMHAAVSQTLAGRLAIITLLPLSIAELTENNLITHNVNDVMFKGGYPRIWKKNLEPNPWYLFYTKTYLEQDVRQITQVHDLSTFERFIRLCAGRIGQIINLSAIASECGISHNTVKAWLSVLEASYIIFLLQPHHKNFNKRLVKSPKLYFYDTGLACALLNIKTEEQIVTHYMRGALFECLVINEIMKTSYNRGQIPSIYFWRDLQGHEIDCVIENGAELVPVEIKSGQTIDSSFFDSLTYWNDLTQADPTKGYLVYGGTEVQPRSKGNVIGWKSIPKIVQ